MVRSLLTALLALTCCLDAAMAEPGDNFDSSVGKLSPEDQAIAKASVTRVAEIRTQGGLCSGALVASDLVLTAWHCVDRVRDQEVTFRGLNETYTSVVVAFDDRHDLAVLKLHRAPPLKPLVVREETKPLAEGTPLLTIGHPLGIRYTTTAGKAIEPLESFFLFNARINQGNSGGPILGRDGQIAGVVIILNQLVGGRELGDAVATKPIRAVIAKAQERKSVSWREARGTGLFDLAYGHDQLLNELADVESGQFAYAIGWDYYDRWRVAFRHFTLKPDRVWGFETGPVFKTIWGSPALLVGRNHYFTKKDDVTANKIGVAFEFWFLDFTVFHVMHEDERYTSYTIGF